MDKDVEDHYSASHQSDFPPLDYSLDHDHPYPNNNHFARQQESSENSIEMVDFMLSNPSPQPQISLDKLSFADVMQLADFGPKLAQNQSMMPGDDDNYFLRFPVLGDRSQEEPFMVPRPPPPLSLLPPPPAMGKRRSLEEGEDGGQNEDGGEEEEEEEARFSENTSSVQFLGGVQKAGGVEVKNRRKRPRSMKTSEEVESQRMTHIAVERNRRRHMNEHLRVLRSLMPGSYVQRGDQASIIGGAIEFVRELEQLLQCLESQKRRRVFSGGEAPRAITDSPPLPIHQPLLPPLPLPDGDHMNFLELDPSSLREEMAENKSFLADIEVRLLGFDAMIKILSRRKPGQLLKTIAALEDLQFNILHTNITTIEQTVLYSFNVKITGETRYTAEDIANSVQQILNFINTSTL